MIEELDASKAANLPPSLVWLARLPGLLGVDPALWLVTVSSTLLATRRVAGVVAQLGDDWHMPSISLLERAIVSGLASRPDAPSSPSSQRSVRPNHPVLDDTNATVPSVIGGRPVTVVHSA